MVVVVMMTTAPHAGRMIVDIMSLAAFAWVPFMILLWVLLSESAMYPYYSIQSLLDTVSYSAAGTAAAAAVLYAFGGSGRRIPVVAGLAVVALGMAAFDASHTNCCDLYDLAEAAVAEIVGDEAYDRVRFGQMLSDTGVGVVESVILTLAGGSVVALGGGVKRKRLVWIGAGMAAAAVAVPAASGIFWWNIMDFLGRLMLQSPPYIITGCLVAALARIGHGTAWRIAPVPAALACLYLYFVISWSNGYGLG